MDPPPPPPLLPQKKKGKSKAIDDDGDLDDDEKENPTEIVQVEETNPSSQSERKSTTDQQQEEKQQQQQRKKSSSTMPRGRGRRRPRRQRLDKDNDFLPLLKQQQQQQQEGGGEEEGRGHEIVISRKRKKTNHSDTSRPRSPSPSPSSNKTIVDDESESMNSSVWEVISDIVMWTNITKSTFWFGLGSTFFVSSSFSRESNFSIISAASHLGILILGLAFFHDSLSNRQTKRLKRMRSFQLTEDDFLRVARLVLPLANSILAKSQEIFSGEPLMTLKVAPILLFTAKFGPLITPWRLFAIGFFLSFTIPKLYSSYSKRICKIVEETKNCVWGAWTLCPNKKLVTASTAAVLWNLFSVKMRFFTAFISVVALRYQQQNIGEGISEKESREPEQQTMMLTDENLHVTAD